MSALRGLLRPGSLLLLGLLLASLHWLRSAARGRTGPEGETEAAREDVAPDGTPLEHYAG